MNRQATITLFDLVSARTKIAFRLGGGICLVLAFLFVAFPEIDIAVSRIFFNTDPEVKGFFLKEDPALNFLFKAVDVISRGVLIIAIGLLVLRAFQHHGRLLSTAIVAFSLIIGPAIVVNAVFKDHWDRARPRQIQEFGGEKIFTPAWVVSNQCDRNCSFTSGHAAAGFSFVVLHFVVRGRRWLWLGLLAGGLIGAARIAVGAHFLSDIVFSFFLVYLTAALVARILVKISTNSAKSISV
jgi:lipid A 4'-phosphatase